LIIWDLQDALEEMSFAQNAIFGVLSQRRIAGGVKMKNL